MWGQELTVDICEDLMTYLILVEVLLYERFLNADLISPLLNLFP